MNQFITGLVLTSSSVPQPSVSKTVIQNEETPESQNLFNLLPQPTNKKPSVVEEDDEFLHKKETGASAVKPKAKISVPSLSDVSYSFLIICNNKY